MAVTVIGFFLLFGGITSLLLTVVGILFQLTPGNPHSWSEAILALVPMFVGISYLPLAMGILKGRARARNILMVVVALNYVFVGVRVAMQGWNIRPAILLLPLAIFGALLHYLFRADATAYFEMSTPSADGTDGSPTSDQSFKVG